MIHHIAFVNRVTIGLTPQEVYPIGDQLLPFPEEPYGGSIGVPPDFRPGWEMKVGDVGYIAQTYAPEDHNLAGDSSTAWTMAWAQVIYDQSPVFIKEDFVQNWLVAYNTSLARGDMLLVPKTLVTVSPAAPPPPPPGGTMTITLSTILKAATFLLSIPAVASWVASLVKGSVTTWDKIPTPVKAILLGLGVVGLAEGVSIIHDLVTGSSGDREPLPQGFNKAWTANGTDFYHNPTTNQYGVYKHNGQFKIYRIRKPVGVVYSDGVSNLKALTKSVKALRKQIKGIEGALTAAEPRKRLAAGEKKFTPTEMRQIVAAVKE